MPIFFHGTRRAHATAMVGPAGGIGAIDVTLGGGEFGRGFYTQDSKSNALTWVQHLPAVHQPCVLEVEIDDQQYAALIKRILDRKRALRLTARLRAKGTVRTHLEGVDVVIGPLNGSNWIEQQKFESVNAQSLLNGPHTQRRVA